MSEGEGDGCEEAADRGGADALPDVVPGHRLRDATGRFLPWGGLGKPAARTIARRRAKATKRRGRKGKPVAWSARGEAQFLETLGETGCIADAIRAAGFSSARVYRRRLRSEEFRAKWAVAMREARVRLECMMLDRAINGIEEAVFYGGKRIAVVRRYDDRQALGLLKKDREPDGDAPPAAAAVPIEERRAQLKAKLSEMNLKMGGAG